MPSRQRRSSPGRPRSRADLDAEEPGDGRRFTATLLASGHRGGDPAARIQRIGPKAANESSSANTVNVEPANAATSAASPAPNGDGASAPAGTSSTATSQSRATSRLTELAIPPSM